MLMSTVQWKLYKYSNKQEKVRSYFLRQYSLASIIRPFPCQKKLETQLKLFIFSPTVNKHGLHQMLRQNQKHKKKKSWKKLKLIMS